MSEPENREDRQQPTEQPQEDDTQGHGLLVDPYSARKLDNSRVADLERESRQRQLRRDARSNR